MSVTKFFTQVKNALALLSNAVLKLFYFCALSVCGACCNVSVFEFARPAADAAVGAEAAAGGAPATRDAVAAEWRARVAALPEDFKDDAFSYPTVWVDGETPVRASAIQFSCN